MDKQPFFSIIIPVYKTEKYLRECVDSLLAQDFTDYEIILVDDESPDSCPAMANRIQATASYGYKYSSYPPRQLHRYRQRDRSQPSAPLTPKDLHAEALPGKRPGQAFWRQSRKKEICRQRY